MDDWRFVYISEIKKLFRSDHFENGCKVGELVRYSFLKSLLKSL
jgi:hypothetical protein